MHYSKKIIMKVGRNDKEVHRDTDEQYNKLENKL